eukprot:SM008868S23781  [mRNA]  locus=s8868:2:432:- [translate_table: standard]
MSTLGAYCGLGKQAHRTLEDVRMNIEVVKSCAMMLLLEANFPDILCTGTGSGPNGSATGSPATPAAAAQPPAGSPG